MQLRKPAPPPRVAWFAAALLLFAASSFFAFRQPPRADVYARPGFLGWLVHPLEVYPEHRLPRIWADVNDLYAVPGTGQVWAVGSGGLVLHSADLGRHWEQIQLARHLQPGQSSAKAAKSSGADVSRADAVSPPRLFPEQAASTDFYAIKFDTAQAGRIVGGRATFATDNAGASWRWGLYSAKDVELVLKREARLYSRTWYPWSLPTGTDANLRAIAFSDRQHGWIGGAGGTLLATEDGGATWFRAARPVPPNAVINAAERARLRQVEAREHYRIFLAPWYYLCLVLVGLSLIPALRHPDPIVSHSPSVADRLSTDRPIESGDADALDLGSVALGLSRFLRNEKTLPPLTLAITGEWGSGKSSLMNLLRADLVRYGFQPVCFNAWHHQKEEHLLASLLETIRAQGLPPWWRPEGAIFRARLLRLRWARLWPLVVLLALPFAGSLGYVWAHPEQLDHFLGALDHLDAKNPDGWLQTFVWKPLAAVDQHGAVLTLLVSLGGLLLAIWRGAKGFGVNPASLLARDSGRIKDLSALTGFRHRFAAEFREITRALNPRTMLILVDDLDRCRPEMVLEVLEAVNFLVSSGDCFVVLGMARDRVVRCVGLSFKDVASELLAPTPGLAAGLAPEDLARQRRLEYAQQYLEKLINIEVPVPIPTPEQTQKILVDEGVEDETPPNRRERLLRQGRAALRWAAPLLLLAGLVTVGFWFGATRGLPTSPTPPSQAGTAAGKAPAAASSTAGSQPAPASAITATPGLAEVDRAEEAHRPAWLLVPLLLLLLGLGIWRLSIPPDIVLRDSEEFEQALAAWHPLVVAFRNTPRSVKRFLNRVRYLAMLQRRQPPEPTGWQRLLARLRHRPEPPQSEESTIPERALVALAAIEHGHPEWLEDPGLFQDAVGFLRAQTLPPALQTTLDSPFLLPSLEPYREAYLRMSRGIHVS